MKTHSTNYYNTFIEIAEDCPVDKGTIPPMKSDEPTIANLQFEMLINHPYKFTSDDVIFQVYAFKNDIAESDLELCRQKFYSKGQACMRTSPLTKRYGWGVHADEFGRIALLGYETEEYQKLASDPELAHTRGMKNKRESR